jgi:hypothetical protein
MPSHRFHAKFNEKVTCPATLAAFRRPAHYSVTYDEKLIAAVQPACTAPGQNPNPTPQTLINLNP